MKRKHSRLLIHLLLITWTVTCLHFIPLLFSTTKVLKTDYPPLKHRQIFNQKIIQSHNKYITKNYTGLIPHLLYKQYRPLVIAKKANLVLFVFAWKRVKSLHRLLESIKSAKYIVGVDVDVNIFLDGLYSSKVESLVENFKQEWTWGTVSIKKRDSQIGLEQSIIQAWPNPPQSTFSLFLEDDVELSPLFYLYSIWTILTFLIPNSPLHSPQIFGASLYTPRVNELTTTDPQRPSEFIVDGMDRIFLLAVPCSWGMVVGGSEWAMFLDYYNTKKDGGDGVIVTGVRSINWTHSWKRYLIDFIIKTSKVVVYPNFPNQTSFSTNHYEQGVHTSIPSSTSFTSLPIVDKTRRETDTIDERFTVPLIKYQESARIWGDLVKFPVLNSSSSMVLQKLIVFGVDHRRVNGGLGSLESSHKYLLKNSL